MKLSFCRASSAANRGIGSKVPELGGQSKDIRCVDVSQGDVDWVVLVTDDYCITGVLAGIGDDHWPVLCSFSKLRKARWEKKVTEPVYEPNLIYHAVPFPKETSVVL
jgi:hypothetical protein